MRSRYLFSGLMISILASLLVAKATAQYTTGSVTGTVTDQSGAIVPGVSVTLKSADTGESRTYLTGRDGEYVFPAVVPGSYSMTVAAAGFEQERVVVQATSSATVTENFSLKPGSESTTIEVDASISTLNTTGAEQQTTRSAAELSYLPTATRSPSDLATLDPAVTPMYVPDNRGALVAVSGAQTGLISAYGSRARATAASLDYTDITDWEFGGFALGTQPNVDMVAEFKVISGPFPAEYGVEAANVVEVTRSGTNRLHGTAYDYIQNDYFNARNYFDTTGKPTTLKQNNYGASLGGPLWRNHSFIFAGFQKLSTRGAGATFTFPVPTVAALTGATDPLALQLFQANVPLPSNAPPGATSANVTDTMSSPTDSYLYLLRGDHHFSPAHAIALRYLFSKGTSVLPFAGTINFLPGYGADFDSGAHSVNLTDTYLFGTNKVNELRIAYGRSNAQFNSQTASNIPRIDFLNSYYSFGEAQFFPQGRLFNTYQINDTFSWIRGRHSLKLGADVRYIQDNSSSTTSGGVRGTFFFASLSSYLAGAPLAWSRVFGSTYEGYRMWVPGFFVQDEWKALPSLTINYGARYEVQGEMNEVHGLTAELDPSRQDVAIGEAGAGALGAFRTGNPAIAGNYKNISPRVGFSWTPASGKLLVRGGYGVYFDTHNFALLANTRFGPPLNSTVSLGGPQFTGGNTFDNIVNGSAPIDTATAAQIGSFGALTNFGSIVSVTKSLANPYTQNYSLGVQYQLGGRTAFSADYLGSLSRKLTDLRPINSVAAPPPAPATLTQEQACIGVPSAPGPCAITVDNESGPGNNRIDPRFDQVDQLQAIGGSNYNAVAVQLKQNAIYGLQAQLSYTYAKSLDDDSDYNLAQISNEESYPQGQSTSLHKLEYGPSDFDITNRFTLTTVWALPWCKRESGLAGHLLGGWVFSTANAWQSGIPATLYSGSRSGLPDPVTTQQITISDVNLDGNVVQTTGSDNTRASLNPGGTGFKFGHPSTIPAPADRGVGTGNTNVSNFKYVQTLVGNYGTLGRNTFRMNSLPTEDWSLSKNTRLSEVGFLGSGPWNFELRADAFNVFNMAFLTATGYQTWNNLANPSFGQYNTAGSSRYLQVAAKINF